MTKVLSVAILLLAGVACRKGPDDAEERLEAIDVESAISIGIEDDQTAVERAPELVGVLPSGFPDDLPLYLPASLIDFGTADGSRFISLLTPHSVLRVEPELLEQMKASGWTASHDRGGTVLSKGGVRLRLRLEDANPGTLYRFEY